MRKKIETFASLASALREREKAIFEKSEDAFANRVERILTALQAHSIDIATTINDAINLYLQNIGYKAPTSEPEHVFHEAAHAAVCATTGNAADEALVWIAEHVLYRSPYIDHPNEDIFAPPLETGLKYGRAYAESITVMSNELFQSKPVPPLEEIAYGLSRYVESGQQLVCMEASIIQFEILEENLSESDRLKLEQRLHALMVRKEESSISESDVEKTYNQIVRREGFFRALTNGRPAYAFSAASFCELPLAFLGVKRAANGSSDLFEPIDEAALMAIENRLA